MRSSRCQGSAAPCVVSSSACDSFGPIRPMTNHPRFSKKMVLFGGEDTMQDVGGIGARLFRVRWAVSQFRVDWRYT